MPASTRSKSKRGQQASNQSDKPEKKKRQLTIFKSPERIARIGTKPPAASPSTLALLTAPTAEEMTQSDTNSDGVKTMRCIKKTLETSFKDVSERLQLAYIQPCLYDLKKCYRIHSYKNPVVTATRESQYLARNYLDQGCHTQFILFVRNSICGVKQFPGSSVVRGILELMLTSPSGVFDGSRQSLIELHSLFISVLTTFPTCHIRNTYLEIFQSPFKIGRKSSSSRGIVRVLLETLNDLINSKPSALSPKKKRTFEQEKLNNFYLWDAQNEEKMTFDQFTREEKLNRVFMVLNLLTRTLEQDLAIFIMKHSNKLQTKLLSSNGPLIASVLWQKNESVMIINSTIKTIISIFVAINALNFPLDKIRVISRLLGLVSHVVNLFEYPDETFEYPIYKNITMDLVREIQKTVEESVYYSLNLCLHVAQQIQSPLIQMLLADQLLQKIHQMQWKISLEVPFDLLRTKSFLRFEDTHELNTLNQNQMYPSHDPREKVLKFKITQTGYLQIIKLYTEAVNNFYHIQAIIDDIKSLDSFDVMTKTVEKCSADFNNFEQNSEIDFDEPVAMKSVDLSFKKLTHIKLTMETCAFYRKETKLLKLLKKLIDKCRVKYGKNFESLSIFAGGIED